MGRRSEKQHTTQQGYLSRSLQILYQNTMTGSGGGGRGSTGLRLSEFVQISEFFQFYITDIVRHLSHFPKVSI